MQADLNTLNIYVIRLFSAWRGTYMNIYDLEELCFFVTVWLDPCDITSGGNLLTYHHTEYIWGINMVSILIILRGINMVSILIILRGINMVSILIILRGINMVNILVILRGINMVSILIILRGINMVSILVILRGINMVSILVILRGINMVSILVILRGKNVLFQAQGPVVQSVVSLTSSLRVISLTVLADSQAS